MMETIRSVSEYISDGDWIESKDQSSCGIRLVQTGNIGNTKYLEKENRSKYISEETFERLHCSEIFAGDILISRLPDPVGRACIVPENMGKAITAVDCTIVRVNKEKCLPKYLLYYTDSPRYRHQIGKYLLGATRIRISRKNLETIQVPVPNINEQQCIVKNLSKVDTLIDKVRDQLLLMDELVKSRFIELFGNVIHNSKSWPMYALSEIASSRLGKMLDAKRQTGLCSYPYLANFNVQWFRFNIEELNQMDFNEADRIEFGLKDGDLLVCEGGEIGRCAVWHNEIQPCFFQKALHRVRCDKDIVHPDYLAWWFKYQCDHNGFSAIAGAKATIAHLPGVKLKQLQVAVPPLKLQQQFADFVAQVDKSKLAAQQGLQELEVLKKSLMQKYFG